MIKFHDASIEAHIQTEHDDLCVLVKESGYYTVVAWPHNHQNHIAITGIKGIDRLEDRLGQFANTAQIHALLTQLHLAMVDKALVGGRVTHT